jgi:hypothetical protein
MFKGEPGWSSETNEQFREHQDSTNAWDNDASFAARRKIERLRELKQLRDLLDDPEFDDLD